jgi:uncharacterized protein YjbI with pentapeptide repeats
MANPEHLEILKHGVERWNQWRKEHPDVRPDLRKGTLLTGKINRGHLRGATVTWVDLNEPSLAGADLTAADLVDADLRRASLSGANCTGANLSGADLSGADLSEANLRNALLSATNLSGGG